ncbi:Metal transporter Nramp2, partial [Dissostichus eleginoides]
TGSPGSLSCMAKRDMINKAAIQMYGAGADFTFLWLSVMTVKMGALGGVLICSQRGLPKAQLLSSAPVSR